MKKILLAMILMLSFGAYAIAQTPAQATPKKKTATTTTTASATKPAAGPTKKDGTADMRYKANKDAAKAKPATTVHTKKDGTPDKRYKENKTK
ncbi:MAG TPA: hypothetical protein VG890_16360 [Puia sp.]|nr:hypothetical protein [Puia sp.]